MLFSFIHKFLSVLVDAQDQKGRSISFNKPSRVFLSALARGNAGLRGYPPGNPFDFIASLMAES
jgi:hypothetical protein